MGAADIVPGVSGGSVALVLGHYKRLVIAISQIDATAMRLVLQRRFADAWTHIDGRFLLSLGIGIAIGIVGLASLMHWLLENRFSETMAVFFGLVLGSGWVVARMVGRWSIANVAIMLISAAIAWGIASLSPMGGEPSVPYLFFCAMIAICAMILPGISGAFVLLLLGAYHPVTGMIKEAAKLNFNIDMILRLTVFGTGCIVGLALFSRVLRYLLEHRANTTFAALLGLMLGSLRKLWPLQLPTEATASLEFKERQWQVVDPSQWPGSIPVLLALIIVSALAILALNHFASDRLALAIDNDQNPQQP
jgi:putative membrane protein